MIYQHVTLKFENSPDFQSISMRIVANFLDFAANFLDLHFPFLASH